MFICAVWRWHIWIVYRAPCDICGFWKHFQLPNANNSFHSSTFFNSFSNTQIFVHHLTQPVQNSSTQLKIVIRTLIFLYLSLFLVFRTHKYSHHCYIYFVCSSIELDDLWKIQMFFYVWLFLGLFGASKQFIVMYIFTLSCESKAIALLVHLFPMRTKAVI